jgi:hypothetical protein
MLNYVGKIVAISTFRYLCCVKQLGVVIAQSCRNL